MLREHYGCVCLNRSFDMLFANCGREMLMLFFLKWWIRWCWYCWKTLKNLNQFVECVLASVTRPSHEEFPVTLPMLSCCVPHHHDAHRSIYSHTGTCFHFMKFDVVCGLFCFYMHDTFSFALPNPSGPHCLGLKTPIRLAFLIIPVALCIGRL